MSCRYELPLRVAVTSCRYELPLRTVLAFPIASRRGLACTMHSSTYLMREAISVHRGEGWPARCTPPRT